MKDKSITQEIVYKSQILSKASYTEIIKLDNGLFKTINNFLLKSFSQETINYFWDWFDRVEIDDYNSVVGEPNDIYGSILVRVRDIIKQNNESSRLYIDGEDKIEIDENFYDILSKGHLVYINKIRSFINQIVIYEFAQDIYDIKEKTKNNLGNTFDLRYKKDFIEDILNKNSKHNNIKNIIYFFEFYGNFDKSGDYSSDILNPSESQLVIINDIRSVYKNGYEDSSQKGIAGYNKYINNFMINFFLENTPDIFDSYKTILDDHKKLDDVEFILKNASHHISKSVSDGNYKMLKLDQRFSYRIVKIDQIININNVIFSIIAKVCGSEYKVTSGAVLKNIENLDENDDNFYTVAVGVNENLEILIYIIKVSDNEKKYEQVGILGSYIIQDSQNLFDVITILGYDQDIYEAVGIPKNQINYNL